MTAMYSARMSCNVRMSRAVVPGVNSSSGMYDVTRLRLIPCKSTSGRRIGLDSAAAHLVSYPRSCFAAGRH
jgi:hypothetical protein